VFLELISSSTFKVKRFNRKRVWKSLGTRKPKWPKQDRKNLFRLYMFYWDEPFC